MDRKAQMGDLGIILISFITIFVGVILFQVVAQEAGSSTSLGQLQNLTITVTNGSTTYLGDYRAISNVIIYNATGTGIVLVNAANYTITNDVINPTDGGLSFSIINVADYPFTPNTWNISGTVQPVTYVADSGARAMVSLIAIFFALAIAVVALEPTLRSGVLNMMGR